MRNVARKIFSRLVIIGVSLQISCDNDFNGVCPGGNNPHPPYENPVWHPSGNIIGFNHIPVKEIKFPSGPCQIGTYNYEMDSVGFWLVEATGKNMRRALPYRLETPAWSPDGKWIAFSQGAQIFKMPFDGNAFDTTAIEQLTFEGRNFFPSWSPDGQMLVFDSNFDSPTGLNFIWKMNSDGSNKKRIAFTPDKGETRMPFWGKDFKIVHIRYVNIVEPEIFQMDSSGNNVIRLTNDLIFDEYPSISPDLQLVSFISESNSKGGFELYTLNIASGDKTKITNGGAMDYSWSPDGRIVYLHSGGVDETNGTLWVMNADGTNQKQLTFSRFKIIN